MYKYILEFKNRCFLLFITWFSVMLVEYLYKDILLYTILEEQLFKNNLGLKLDYFIFTNVLEIFSVYIQLIIFTSLQISFFYGLYHIFLFLSSGLFVIEYYSLKFMLKTIILVFICSILLSNFFLIPMMWNFFLKFQNLEYINLHFEAKLNEYVTFFITFYYIFIIYSQLLSLLIFWFHYILANLNLIKKFRKIYYYFFVIFSTLISPPDIFSQVVFSFSLIFIYELFVIIFIIKFQLNFLAR